MPKVIMNSCNNRPFRSLIVVSITRIYLGDFRKGEIMTSAQKTLITAIIVLAIVGIVMAAGRVIQPDSTTQPAIIRPNNPQPVTSVRTAEPLWLSKFEGKLVRVTFAETPPDLDKQFTCPLIKVEQTGIVLRFGNQRQLFFPYSNIICVDPM